MMMRNDIIAFNESHVAIPLLQNIVDETTFKIILSTIDVAKTVFQICNENKIPISSTYKKIRKLQYSGLVFIKKIEIDNKGKKVILYKSKIKALEFSLKKDGSILLQFCKNNDNSQL
jgi:regulator of PEP synthase PpsR (kinase-PPPase family)